MVGRLPIWRSSGKAVLLRAVRPEPRVAHMKRGLVVLGVALLCLAGCGGEPGAEGNLAASHPPSATVTVTQTPVIDCEKPHIANANLLADRWALVVASAGSSDHSELAKAFSDGAAELAEDFDRGTCKDDRTYAAASMLAYRAALVSAQATIGGELDAKTSGDVVKAGNGLLELMGSEGGVRFIPLSCTGSVDTTPACTAIDLG